MQLSIESYQKSHFQEQCNHTEGKISTFLTHTDAFYLKYFKNLKSVFMIYCGGGGGGGGGIEFPIGLETWSYFQFFSARTHIFYLKPFQG